jgi:uncharacterized small protein (DUF1192 family)
MSPEEILQKIIGAYVMQIASLQFEIARLREELSKAQEPKSNA